MRVDGVGSPIARVMFVGEAPGEQEDRMGRPFVGKAGDELDFWLDRTCRLSRDDVFVTNMMRTRPPANRDPKPEEIARDLPDLWSEICGVQPEIIVPLGLISTRYFLGEWATMELTHGLPHRASVEFGGQRWEGTVLPIVHPAAGLHTPQYYAQTVWGFEQLAKFLAGELPHHETDTEPVFYGESDNAPLHLERLADYPRGIIAIDTEGSAEAPWCLTVSAAPRDARLIRATSRLALDALAHAISTTSPTVVLHYAPHDLRVLDAMGVHIDPSRIRVLDTMQLAYIAGRLPQGLKALAYRLCGMRMREYEDLINEHDQRVAQEWLTGLIQRDDIQSLLRAFSSKKEEARWASTIDKEKRRHAKALVKFRDTPATDTLHARWDRSVLAERLGITEPMPHATLDDVPFEEVLHYACTDADATRRVYLKLREYFD